MIDCPECGAAIDVEEDELDEGESVLCEECGKNFVVSSVDPLELETDGEGFDDEEFDEEFDEEDDEEDEEEEEEEEDDDWR
ncbi:MAG: hypothetical protein QM757_44605 [Paludibaculum sp.]|jgi:alpha-aminoadipate carrier protein LysW|uniref:Lysine biosynthesis protein LysW n=1 Tax=Paludibaculum fermentans TaxID=1473598 RepID=A0A7S7SGI5_PALFE|nr:MJ0042-type zinc finger domain-containing protein [Paludibaculum fermentans]MBN9657465.1 hypothetical protein [Acidobacteriota bacterium]QOY84877.1 hypothetical protein IRI77_18605 [Paludibaculum fermentans]